MLRGLAIGLVLAANACGDAPVLAASGSSATTPPAAVTASNAPQPAAGTTSNAPAASASRDASGLSEVGGENARPRANGGAQPTPPRVVLWVGGDVIVPPGMIRAARANGDGDLAAGLVPIFAPVARFWRADPDAHVIVNLESPVADQTRLLPNAFVHLARGGRLVPSPLNVPRAVPEALRRSGVHSVTLANNHALDQGRDGLGETIANVRAAGLGIIGAGDGALDALRPMVLGPPGARTAVFSLLDRHRREPPVGPAIALSRGRAPLAEIRRAAAAYDAVIVVLHVVAELRERPLRGWRRLVDEFIEAGADIVLVHGSHVVGPVHVARVEGRPTLTAWGLGNLLSEMGQSSSPRTVDRPSLEKWDTPRAREQLLARVEVRPRSASGGGTHPRFGTRAHIDVGFLPLWMSHDRDLVERRVIRGPIRHQILPISACGPAAELPRTWPTRERDAVLRWLARRRDHLLRASRLRSARCASCGADETCSRAVGPHLLAAPDLAE